MVRQAKVNFYFGISTVAIFGNTLPAAGLGLIAFLLILAVILPISLSGYTEEKFNEWKDANLKLDGEVEEQEDKQRKNYGELLISNSKGLGKLKDYSSPETRAGLLMKINLLLLVVIPTLAFLLNGNAPNKALFDYIMYGDWMRGVSLFALCGILMVATISLMILIICNLLLSLIVGFTGRGGETICRLLYSLVRYVAILVIIYYIFEYLGLSMSTYLASLGTVSLALSIGSRDMVADIMAGIMILFERQFQVGDYVDMDGCRGQVLEMGIRSTKLLCQGDDIRFISNSNIRSVVNKTKRLSVYSTELTIATSDSIEKVEELFNRELPEIQKKKRMIKELKLGGISRVSGGGRSDREKSVSVKIKWSCQEGDQETVRDFITREIFLLCERENIEIR
jgi:small conductance mechanosensitive channel